MGEAGLPGVTQKLIFELFCMRFPLYIHATYTGLVERGSGGDLVRIEISGKMLVLGAQKELYKVSQHRGTRNFA